MSDEDKDSKTEEASGKKLQDALDRGQFARSQELQVVCTLGAALAALSLTMNSSARELATVSAGIFSSLASVRLQLDTAPVQLAEIMILVAKILAPLLGACVLAAVPVGGIQSGFQLTPKALEWSFGKLNPLTGFTRVFSKNSAVHSGVEFLKMIAIAGILWMAARGIFRDPLFSVPVEISYFSDFLRQSTITFFSRLLLALGVIAAISYWYELRKTQKDLMMTKEEVKEEHKQAEGNTQAKGALRRMARRLLQKQMLAAIPTADVIITNPTHYAVALKYERGVDQAPMVLAKGENRFARRIKELAAEHGVPVIENKPVARMLFAVGKVGESIPSELYQAVAGILAFVYRTHRYYFYRLKARRAEAAAAAK